MHDTVFKLAVAVILAAAIIFMLAATSSQLSDSANSTVENIAEARRLSLEKSVIYLQ